LGSLFLVAIGIAALTLVLLYPNLPSIEAVTDYRPKLPLKIFTIEGDLIGEITPDGRLEHAPTFSGKDREDVIDDPTLRLVVDFLRQGELIPYQQCLLLANLL
jgi:hypothetical protein